MRAELKASLVEVQVLAKGAATLEMAERTTDEEFKAGFFQRYVDLKRRVALDHPDWDL